MLILLPAKKPTAIKDGVSGRLSKPVLYLNEFEAVEVKHEIITYWNYSFNINIFRLSAG
jgi:hypothetical protein